MNKTGGMTPKDAAQSLRKTGMRDPAIAKAVDASVPTINRIRKGRDCLWSIGDRLIRYAASKGLEHRSAHDAGEGA